MAQWKPSLAESLNLPVDENGWCFTEIDTIIQYKDESENQYALVVFGSYEMDKNDYDDCLNCTPILGAALFNYSLPGYWRIMSFDVAVTWHGSAGGMGEISLVKIGKSEFAMELRHGYAAQGFLGTWVKYYKVGTFDKVLALMTHEDNWGYTDDKSKRYEYDVEVRIVPTIDGYYKITAKSKGTQSTADGSKVIPANGARTFFFDEFAGIFVETKE